jgi:predicted nucleic acid-binding protein
VKAFLDTSVLVATFYGDHEHHVPSKDLFLRFERQDICCAAHSLAELYSVSTGMPGRYRVSGDEALLFLANVRERLTVIYLGDLEYFGALEGAAELGISGGAIYDVILGWCALKSKAEVIYSWNLKDFKRLGPEIAARATTP